MRTLENILIYYIRCDKVLWYNSIFLRRELIKHIFHLIFILSIRAPLDIFRFQQLGFTKSSVPKNIKPPCLLTDKISFKHYFSHHYDEQMLILRKHSKIRFTR